jgi:hypothetical protein
MTTCKDVAEFLAELNGRNVIAKLQDSDVQMLQKLNLLQLMTSDEFQQLKQDVTALQQAQEAISHDTFQRAQVSDDVTTDTRKVHSILFHLEGVDKQHASLERLQQEQQAIKTIDEDLAKRQQDLAQLMVKKSLLDTSCPYDSRFISITTQGRMALRDLNVALYRASDQDFTKYWTQSQTVDNELTGIANQSAIFEKALESSLHGFERTDLWAVSIGMSKSPGDPQTRLNHFIDAFNGTAPFSPNLENRLMAAESLSVVDKPLDQTLKVIESLNGQVREMNVPIELSLGVAAILVLGQRADGHIPFDEFVAFLPKTPSFEAAALLALPAVNYEDVMERFTSVCNLVRTWGYSTSDDTELSAAYLAVSEVPIDSVTPKMAIITKGLSGYLQYPLVAAAILASIPVLEANETLNLLEKAYEILGQRTGPISQAEGICLAVRMIHGIDVHSLGDLDPTAAVKQGMPNFYYGTMPPRIWMPMMIVHTSYYSTWSGIGGPHPGHVHTWGGGGWGGGYTG